MVASGHRRSATRYPPPPYASSGVHPCTCPTASSTCRDLGRWPPAVVAAGAVVPPCAAPGASSMTAPPRWPVSWRPSSSPPDGQLPGRRGHVRAPARRRVRGRPRRAVDSDPLPHRRAARAGAALRRRRASPPWARTSPSWASSACGSGMPRSASARRSPGRAKRPVMTAVAAGIGGLCVGPGRSRRFRPAVQPSAARTHRPVDACCRHGRRPHAIGIGEGVITALVVGSVLALRPDLVHGAADAAGQRHPSNSTGEPSR
jgi:hypothetical protein